MARIIKSSGKGPLYTGDAFGTVIDRDVKRVPGESGVQKLGKALQLAETLAKSEVVGAVGGLIGKGVSKLGQSIEEAGIVSEAEKERAAFEAEKAQALKTKEAELETPTAEADAVQKEMIQKMDRNKFITDLRDKVKNVNRDTRTEVLKYIGEGAKRGLLTPEESQKLALKIDEKVMTPVGKDVADRLEKEIGDLEYEASGERVKLEMMRDKGIETGVEYEDAKNRYTYLKQQADKKRREKEAAVGGVEVETPTEGSPVKEIIKQIRSSGRTDQALLALREKARKGQITFQQKLVLDALEEELAREETVGGEVIETTGRETKVSKTIPKKSTLAGIKDKTPEQMRTEAERSSLEIGSEEEIPMEPTPAEPSLDERERLRKEAVQKDIDALRGTKFTSSRGVTYDEKGNPIVPRGPEKLSEEELLSAARKAKTLEEQAKVLAAIEDADIAPKTLLDMATGAHKIRFADKVKGLFTKITLPKEMSPDEIAFLRARTAKTQEEAKVIAPKAEAEIGLKEAKVGTEEQRRIDLEKKNAAEVKGYGYWDSVIKRNIRPPRASGGMTKAQQAKMIAGAVEAARKAALGEVKDTYEKETADIKKEKQLNDREIAKYNAISNPGSPPPRSAGRDAMNKYNQAKQKYSEAQSKKAELEGKNKEYDDKLQTAKEKAINSVKNINEVSTKEQERLFKDAGFSVTLPRVPTTTKPDSSTPKADEYLP